MRHKSIIEGFGRANMSIDYLANIFPYSSELFQKDSPEQHLIIVYESFDTQNKMVHVVAMLKHIQTSSVYPC